jgi:Ulp1 family protease
VFYEVFVIFLRLQNIDFYLEMIKHRNNRQDSTYPKVYIFQSYFYKLLDKRGYESVQGASGKVRAIFKHNDHECVKKKFFLNQTFFGKFQDVQDNIFQYELVLIPIHSDHHWVLVVVDFAEKSMMCYDSMDHDNEKHLRVLKFITHIKNLFFLVSQLILIICY